VSALQIAGVTVVAIGYLVASVFACGEYMGTGGYKTPALLRLALVPGMLVVAVLFFAVSGLARLVLPRRKRR